MQPRDDSHGDALDLTPTAASGVEAIDKLARSAKVNGPIAFSLGAGVGLALIGLLLRVGDKVDYRTFKLVCILGVVLLAIAGGLALVRYWTKGKLIARIVASDLEAGKADREASQGRLDKASRRSKDPLL